MQASGLRAARGAVAPMLAPASFIILLRARRVRDLHRCEVMAVVAMECDHTVVSESVRYKFEIRPVMGFVG